MTERGVSAVALVPARSGSQRVPHKNVAVLAGHPLMAYTLAATTFLRELCQVLGLGEVEIHTGRAEELGLDKAFRQQYDAVTARGVAPLPVLCEYCLPLVKVGGLMLAPKKGDISRELIEGKRAAFVLGGGPPDAQAFRLPGEEDDRFVVVIKKRRNTPAAYPRRVGVANTRPLGS